MVTNTKHVNDPMNGRMRSVAAKVGRFLLRFLEMQIPMVLGASVCLLLSLLIRFSSSYSTVYFPGSYLYAAGDALFLSVPVMLWMILRSYGWRHSFEMAIALIAPVAAISVVSELAGYAYLQWLVTAGYPAMCLGMFVYMLYRREMFTTNNHLVGLVKNA